MPIIGSNLGYSEMFGDVVRVMSEPVPAITYKIN